MARRGSRPNSLTTSLCTARTSLPALARSTGAYHWKPGKPSQTSALSSCVSASLVSRLRRPSFGELEVVGRARAPAPGLGRVEQHGTKVAQLRLQQRELPPLPAGHEHQPAGLKLHQALEQPALLGRQLPIADAHIAQENDVITRQLVKPGGELLDVVLVAAARPWRAPGGRAGTTRSTPGSRERAFRR